ncbi:F-box domain containing protein, partial [Tanacetum coccineum]
MDRLHSSNMLDIFSRVPAKCLARSRCVSKVWCEYIDDRYLTTVHDKQVIEEPTPILYHTRLSQDGKFRSLCFHVIESKQTETGTPVTYVLEPFLEFLRKKPLKKSLEVRIHVRGSCNGLMFLSQDDGYAVTSLVVVHPLKKECYKVPPLPMRFDLSMFRESCGLGFDASTNTLKIVCVLLKDHGAVRKNLCTLVHEIGTNSWREIPQVPPYHITDGAVFANGCLHWLVSHIDIMTEDGGRPVIRFDVEKEEFGLIDPPKRMCDIWRDHNSCIDDHLVDLNGEVGFVCVRTMEIWVLKQKKWVPYCRLENTIVPDGRIDVLGCWNRDGDM